MVFLVYGALVYGAKDDSVISDVYVYAFQLLKKIAGGSDAMVWLQEPYARWYYVGDAKIR